MSRRGPEERVRLAADRNHGVIHHPNESGSGPLEGRHTLLVSVGSFKWPIQHARVINQRLVFGNKMLLHVAQYNHCSDAGLC